MLSVRRWRQLSSSSLLAPVAASAADCPHGGDLVTALSPPDRRAALLCGIDAERAARGLPWSARADSSRARPRATPTTWSCGASSATSRPAARRSATAVNATGYIAGRRDWELGEAIAWAQQTARHARQPHARAGWPAPGTARSSSIRRFRDVGIGVTPGLTDGSANPRRHRRPRLRLPHRVAYAAAMALGDSVRAHGAAHRGRGPLGAHRPRRARGSRPRRSSAARPPAPLPGRSSCRCRRLPPSPRRDQLRLGLVPHPAQAHGLLGLLHRRVEPRRPLARRRRLDRRAAARDALRRGGRDPRPEPRPRAHGPLRPGPARARALPRRAPRARRRRRRRADRRSASPSCWPAA